MFPGDFDHSTLKDNVLEKTVSGNGKSEFSDPAFAGNKSLPVHRWVPWIAGFSANFVASAIDRYAKSRATVLDPFAGVGTTLVEGLLKGCHTIGFEINPYPAFASRVKTQAQNISVVALQREIRRFQEHYARSLTPYSVPKSKAPLGFKTRVPFYSEAVLRKVLFLQDFIINIDNSMIRDIFRIAFASTMVSYSNYSYEPSLGRRSSAGKSEIIDYPVDQAILGKLNQMVKDIVWFKAMLPKDGGCTSKVVNTSFFDFSHYIETDSIDLIVTSPPYLNNYHYNRNTRPQLYWLGFVERPADLKTYEEQNFGKFWQTVRGEKAIDLKFSIDHSDIQERLDLIRSLNPEKGIYGGSGWANYAASYFNDCFDFAQALNAVLRSGGTALVVIGNSILQGVFIPTDRYFAQIAQSLGLEIEMIEIPRDTRVGNSIIKSDVRVGKANSKQRLYEAVVVLKKR